MVLNKRIVQYLLCVVLGSMVALSIHICVQSLAQNQIKHLVVGLQLPAQNEYSPAVTIAAYVTALIPVSLATFIYSKCGHMIRISNRLLKALVVAAILLELKGDLIRVPLMNCLYYLDCHAPCWLLLSFLSQCDKWAANFALAIILVYLRPAP